MSRIHSKNTGVEKLVFAELRRRKIYFQKHYKKAVGCPDIALPSKKKAVFIDGDFWHGYLFFRWQDRIPKEYWRDKIRNNIRRDKRNRSKLKRDGWKVLRVWSHQLGKNPSPAIEKIAIFLK
jgi:DNA mismatch endonuclease (patch repair protein)